MSDEASESVVGGGAVTQDATETQKSNEATIIDGALGGTESTCNNADNAEASAVSFDGDRKKSLEFADELMDKGIKAIKDSDYAEAAECFSRCLEIRVAHYGELSPQCVKAYYEYGKALLYKAQLETDPLGSVPKEEDETQEESTKVGSVKIAVNGESSSASVSSNAEHDASLSNQEAADDGASGGKDQEEDDEDSADEELAEADEDETELDLAWKMLDLARAIAEKDSEDTLEKVDILSALAEVALEREDTETSVSDYQKAISILERLVEPDSRRIAELHFRLCMSLEVGSKPQEAIVHCQKAISVCKARVRRLMLESRSFSESTASSSVSVLEPGVTLSSNVTESDNTGTDKQAEIEDLNELFGDLENKLEDLQQLASKTKSALAELLGIAKGSEKSASSAVLSSSRMGTADNNGGFDSPTVSTAHTNGTSGVTHLGVVGRGVKRVLMNAGTTESSSPKKPALDSSEDKGEGNM